MRELIEHYRIVLITIVKRIRSVGLFKTLEMIYVALLDERDDKRRNLIAHYFYDPKICEERHPHAIYANYYRPVRTKPFRELLKILSPETKNQNFVDIGAGMGKAMILAAEYGFKRTRGVELIRDICFIAESNFKNFQKFYPNTSFEITHGDVLNFILEENDSFFFLNDPFSEEIFKQFLQKLRAHRVSRGLPIMMVYKNNNRRFIPSLNEIKNDPKVRYQVFDINSNYFEVCTFL